MEDALKPPVGRPKDILESTGGWRRLCMVAGAIPLVIGLLVLIGWALGIEALKRVRPDLVAANPVSAICFILGGAAVILGRSGHRRAVAGAAAAILLVAAAKMASFLFDTFAIDQILFDPSARNAANSMSPHLATALILVGIALMLGTSRRAFPRVLAQSLAITSFLIATFVLLNYGVGTVPVDADGRFIPMAFQSAAALLALSTGIFIAHPNQGLMRILRDTGVAGTMARTILPLALLCPIVIGALRPWGEQQGYYGAEMGSDLQLFGSVLATFVLLSSSIAALYRSDLTRRDRESALARSQQQYWLAESIAKVGHWRMDLATRSLEWSDAAFHIHGLEASSHAPTVEQAISFYHPEDRAAVVALFAGGGDAAGASEVDLRIIRRDGEIRHIKSYGRSEKDAGGKVVSTFGVCLDVTEIELCRREAEAATAAKTAFLANMSHEIRTPMSGVMGFAELLLDAELPPEPRQHAMLIHDSAKALLKLVNDILDVSKIDAGELEICEELVAPAELLGQCVELMSASARAKGIELSLQMDARLPERIMLDATRLRQVVLNLLGNAVKFTDGGFVAVDASQAIRGGDRFLIIHVRDTGVGIDSEHQVAIFDEFVQADASISKRFGGTGLGLSISRRLVTLMGGELELHSRVGEGTLIAIILPLHDVPSELETAGPSTGSDAVSKPIERASILVVEDMEINQQLVFGMLTRMGHKVEIAGDGIEALECVARHTAGLAHYDLILMDVQMPLMDGLAATRAIRAQSGNAAGLPIVALTANAYVSGLKACREAGMSDHLSKPFTMAEIDRVVSRWVGETDFPNGRRDTTGSPLTALHPKFTAHCDRAVERLTELEAELRSCGRSKVVDLRAEARGIAHQLAGTAAMFGQPRLGQAAAEIDDALSPARGGPDSQNIRTMVISRVEQLAEALKAAA